MDIHNDLSMPHKGKFSSPSRVPDQSRVVDKENNMPVSSLFVFLSISLISFEASTNVSLSLSRLAPVLLVVVLIRN